MLHILLWMFRAVGGRHAPYGTALRRVSFALSIPLLILAMLYSKDAGNATDAVKAADLQQASAVCGVIAVLLLAPTLYRWLRKYETRDQRDI